MDKSNKKVEELYDFQNHSYCMVIHMDNEYITLKHFLSKLGGFSNEAKYTQRGKACITYDKNREEVKDWGEDTLFKVNEEEHEHVSGFMDKLLAIFTREERKRKSKKGKEMTKLGEESGFEFGSCEEDEENDDEQIESDEEDENSNNDKDDEFWLKAISTFIKLKFSESFEYREIVRKSCKAFHYIFIIPAEWDHKIKERVIRPLFKESKLISEDDSKDRLLLVTDLETTFYHLQSRVYASINNKAHVFIKGEEIVLCRIDPKKDGSLYIKFNLISPQIDPLGVSEAALFPLVKKSTEVSLSLDYFKDRVREFLIKKMTERETNEVCEDKILRRIIDHVLCYFTNRKSFYSCIIDDYSGNFLFENIDLTDWNLNETQTKILRSIQVKDICKKIDKNKDENNIYKNIQNLTGKNTKKRRLVLAHIYSSFSQQQLPPLVPWLENVLKSHEKSLYYDLVRITSGYKPTGHISLPDMMAGAASKASEVLRNSQINAKPCVIPKSPSKISQDSPSSIFLNTNQNATITIDISMESTSVSYSILNENGKIEETLGNNHFTENRNILPLASFFAVLDEICLKVKPHIILFMDEYMDCDLEYFSKYDRRKKADTEVELERRKPDQYFFRRKTNIMNEIQRMFQDYSSVEEDLTYKQQKKYIRVFLVMYLAYLNEEILNGLTDDFNAEDSTKIGYVISIEKILLDNLVNSKEEFKELVLASGVILEDDNSRKLKIITQGEEILPLIQQSFEESMGLKFSLKSSFMLFQLHENYVQITLNQVVKDCNKIVEDSDQAMADDSDLVVECSDPVEEGSNKEREATAIIIQDEIIPIPNIFNSFYMKIWKCVTEKYEFLKLCSEHEGDDNLEFLELLSRETRAEFFETLKEDIIYKFILNVSDDPVKAKVDIQLSPDCECRISPTYQDIINIGFTPAFKRIATIISASLANKDLFGNYSEIYYVFGLIYFNRNPEFQETLSMMLTKKLETSLEEQQITTKCFTIKELPNHFLWPEDVKQSFLNKDFRHGSLHQVSSESYGFFITRLTGAVKQVNCSYKDKKTDKVVTKRYQDHIFPLLNKGEVITNAGLDKVFHLETQDSKKKIDKEIVVIGLYKLKKIDDVNSEKRIPMAKNFWDELKDFKLTNYKPHSDIPIMISMRPNCYNSTLDFSVRFFGQRVASDEEYRVKVGESMTLARF